MDGQQRLNAIHDFIGGGFSLSGLEVLTPLNGIHYKRCPPRIKRALDRASLSAIVLLLESTSTASPSLPDVRRFIFNRLNTGGTKLNQQEVRNAIYSGRFNDKLTSLSRFNLFTDAFEIPAYIETDPNDYYENELRQKNTLYSSMADCQLVLRYFALKDDKNIRGSMKSMLDRAMEVRMGISADEADALELEYRERFSTLYYLFEGKPFRLAPDEQGRRRISAALYDASMVAIDRLWEMRENIKSNSAVVRSRVVEALKDEASLTLITGQGNTANAVRDRINLMVQILTPGI